MNLIQKLIWLEMEFPRNIHGKTLLAKQLTVLLWNDKSDLKDFDERGIREVLIPADSLNKSLTLAKKLQGLASAEAKKLAALAKKRKAMKGTRRHRGGSRY